MSVAARRAPLSAPVPYFAASRSLAPKICARFAAADAALGPHTRYVEPFSGSAAVLHRKPRCAIEIINDAYGDIANLNWCLTLPSAVYELADRVEATLFCEQTCRAAVDVLRSAPAPRIAVAPHDVEKLPGLRGDADGGERGVLGPTPAHVERAYWCLVAAWMGNNGNFGVDAERLRKSVNVRWNDNGGSPVRRWASVAASINPWHERLRDVVVLDRDGFGVITAVPDERDVLLYVDPPYISDDGKSAGAQYALGWNGESEHHRLADALRRFERARVVVSYYAHPLLAELYPTREGWRIIELKDTSDSGLRTLSAAQLGAAGDQAKRVEVLVELWR